MLALAILITAVSFCSVLASQLFGETSIYISTVSVLKRTTTNQTAFEHCVLAESNHDRSSECNIPNNKHPYGNMHLPNNRWFLTTLLLVAGDIHPNPGPSSLSDSSVDSSTSYINIINSGLSVMHLNIQSIKPKLEILEIEAQPYDVLVFTETWLSPDTPNETLLIPNFSPHSGATRLTQLAEG
ncbi:MAG: hypothetical protein ABW185_15925 [Sedimenticola sp.]